MFAGNAGGDIKGVKGRMYALDAKTGKIVWEFYLVPKAPGDIDARTAGEEPARHLHMEKPARHPDHRRRNLDILHARSGDGAVICTRRQSGARFRAPPRARARNLFSGSVVVLDAKTGAYKMHFKIVPVDWHDWDVSNPPAIIHTRWRQETADP